MGIQGLLASLKGCSREAHISKYAGKSVAVDAFCWLHRAAYTCSRELCEDIPTTRHIDFCMGRIAMLQSHDIRPIIVFDGQPLPSKRNENEKRKKFRRDNLCKARAHMASGNSKKAQECYQRAVDINDKIVTDLIQALEKKKIQFVLAPYEADSQAAFLNIKDHVHAIVTEDSDLLVYSSPRVFLKMDNNGNGVEIEYSNIFRCPSVKFMGLTHQQFVDVCILAGCDYTDKIKGVGISTAIGLVKSAGSVQQIIKRCRLQGAEIPPDYELSVKKARALFYHARVFDIESREMVEINPLEPSSVAGELSGESLDFLGPLMDKSSLLKHVSGQSKRPFTAIEDAEDVEESQLSSSASVAPPPKRHYSFARGMSFQQNAHLSRYLTELPVSESVKRPFVSPRFQNSQKDGLDVQAPQKGPSASLGRLTPTGKKSKYFQKSGNAHAGIQNFFQSGAKPSPSADGSRLLRTNMEPLEKKGLYHNKENLSPSQDEMTFPSGKGSMSQSTPASSKGTSMYKKWKERLLRDGNNNTSNPRSDQSDALQDVQHHEVNLLQDGTETGDAQPRLLVVPESTKIAKRCLANFEAQISTFRLKKRE